MAALTEQGRGQVLSSGSDTGPQITKARRSWCLLFHVHQIISYLKDTRLIVHGLFNPKKDRHPAATSMVLWALVAILHIF